MVGLEGQGGRGRRRSNLEMAEGGKTSEKPLEPWPPLRNMSGSGLVGLGRTRLPSRLDGCPAMDDGLGMKDGVSRMRKSKQEAQKHQGGDLSIMIPRGRRDPYLRTKTPE